MSFTRVLTSSALGTSSAALHGHRGKWRREVRKERERKEREKLDTTGREDERKIDGNSRRFVKSLHNFLQSQAHLLLSLNGPDE